MSCTKNTIHPSPKIIKLSSTPSTNSYLKELLKHKELPECSAVLTDAQPEGRGQMGNRWESEPRKNLIFSMVFFPRQIKAVDQFILTQCISTAIVQVLKKIIPQISIKWPNDLYFGSQKLGGILIENILKGPDIQQCVAGIGINVNQTTFLSNAPNPVSIKSITGKEYDPASLFRDIYKNIVVNYLELASGNTRFIRQEYNQMLFRKTGWHAYRDENGLFEACFKKIEASGHLILERRDGRLSRYAFKEVRFV